MNIVRSEHSQEKQSLLTIPAYADQINEDEQVYSTAYVKVVSRFYPERPAQFENGMRIASKYGCFCCPSPSRRGGGSNSGSFKAIIPGWHFKTEKGGM